MTSGVESWLAKERRNHIGALRCHATHTIVDRRSWRRRAFADVGIRRRTRSSRRPFVDTGRTI